LHVVCGVIRSLRDEFRCIALDYPGFGLSSPRPGYRYLSEGHAQVVTAFVDALALNGVTLVAHDWGGPIGLATVEQRPGTLAASNPGRQLAVAEWGCPPLP
jgi:haloalkane dehalogenase